MLLKTIWLYVQNAPWNAQAVNIRFSLFFSFLYNVLLSKDFYFDFSKVHHYQIWSLHRFLQKIILSPGFCVYNFSLVPSNFSLTRETDKVKSLTIFVTESFIIQESGFWSFAKLLTFSLVTKVIYTKYSKHEPYTVAHTLDCVCSKTSNHGLTFSLFKFFVWKNILN